MDNLGYDRRGRSTVDSDIFEVIEGWQKPKESTDAWIPTRQLYELERWDPAWLEAIRTGALRFAETDHLHLTDLCEIVDRPFGRRDIALASEYEYFEVADTDLDTGEVLQTWKCRGSELLEKGRLRLRLAGGEVLLPNHRDSLIAKSAKGVGRSAVWLSERFGGVITSNRFTVLRAKIDPRLLVVVLNSKLVRDQLVLHSRGSASFDIRNKVLQEIWVPRTMVSETVEREVRELWQRRATLGKELDRISDQLHAIGKGTSASE